MASLDELLSLHQKYCEFMTPGQLSLHQKYIHADDFAALKNFINLVPSESNLEEFCQKANHVHTIIYCEAQLMDYGINLYSNELGCLTQNIVSEALYMQKELC